MRPVAAVSRHLQSPRFVGALAGPARIKQMETLRGNAGFTMIADRLRRAPSPARRPDPPWRGALAFA
jgi:hypothetical protein